MARSRDDRAIFQHEEHEGTRQIHNETVRQGEIGYLTASLPPCEIFCTSREDCRHIFVFFVFFVFFVLKGCGLVHSRNRDPSS